jgi:hypothetical protein
MPGLSPIAMGSGGWERPGVSEARSLMERTGYGTQAHL